MKQIAKKKLLLALALLGLTGFSIIANALEIGQSAPQFVLPSLQKNQPVELKSYLGKVIYIDFWASWCAPCRTSFPLLDALHKKLQAKGFEVIGINLDEDTAKAEEFIKELPVGFTLLQDSKGEWADKYVIESMPTSFIVDKHGVVKHIHNGFTSGDIVELEKVINTLLAE